MRRALKMAGAAVLLPVAAIGGFLLWAASGRGDGSEVLEGPILTIPNAAPPRRPDGTLAVVTWNIAYGRGPGGDESGPWTEQHFTAHLDGIADLLRALDPDIAVLQEVDLDSARSHHIDQPEYLARRLGWGWYACVVTWQNRYVPFPYWPPARQYGRMKSGQCVLSRLPLTRSVRHRLPQPGENPFWYNAFYLHRAVQHVVAETPLGPIDLFNAHTEAYSRSAREEHARRLVALAKGHERALVLGDLNAPPPEAERQHGFEDEPEADFRGDQTITTLRELEGFREVLAAEQPERTHTFPADAPTRRLDYIFAGPGLEVRAARVASEGAQLSDHLPIYARFSLAGAGTE